MQRYLLSWYACVPSKSYVEYLLQIAVVLDGSLLDKEVKTFMNGIRALIK